MGYPKTTQLQRSFPSPLPRPGQKTAIEPGLGPRSSLSEGPAVHCRCRSRPSDHDNAEFDFPEANVRKNLVV